MIAIRHIGITVDSPGPMKDFYCDLLGFKVVSDQIESGDYIDNFCDIGPDVYLRAIKLKDSTGGMIELLYFQNRPGFKRLFPYMEQLNSKVISHFALTVPNLEKMCEFLKANNVEMICEPQGPENGSAWAAFCKDPEGNLIELVEDF